MAVSDLTAARLRELLSYDAETGEWTWRVARRRMLPGSPAGTVKANGYLQISIDNRTYSAHRLAWLYVNGAWPSEQIDHINGIRQDNRFANLRDVRLAENIQNNFRARKGKTSCALLGVTKDKRTKKWKAAITANGVVFRLGQFETAEAGHAAYLEAKLALHSVGTNGKA